MSAAPPANAMQLAATFRFGLILLAYGILLLAFAIAVTDFVATPTLPIELVKLLLLFGCAWGIAAGGLPRTGGLFAALALFAGLSCLASLLSMILAASARPYADALLAGADAWLLGKDFATDLVRFGRTHPDLLSCLSGIYGSINLQPLLLILLLSYRGRHMEIATFLNAWGIALALCLLIFPFVPAVGFYVHHAIPFASMRGLTVDFAWTHLDTLAAIRSGALRSIDGQRFCGIVTFPSFHTAAAILLAWGFRRHNLLRWPILLLNIAMIVSAVFVGGHYIVDLIGGIAIALVAIHLSAGIAGQPIISRADSRLFPSTPNRLWLR